MVMVLADEMRGGLVEIFEDEVVREGIYSGNARKVTWSWKLKHLLTFPPFETSMD
jgi:hypothetical protein